MFLHGVSFFRIQRERERERGVCLNVRKRKWGGEKKTCWRKDPRRQRKWNANNQIKRYTLSFSAFLFPQILNANNIWHLFTLLFPSLSSSCFFSFVAFSPTKYIYYFFPSFYILLKENKSYSFLKF